MPFLLRCCERDGWTEKAFAVRQRQFQRLPTVERYQAVVAAGVRSGAAAEGVRTALFDVSMTAEQRAVDEAAARPGRLRLFDR